MNTDAMMCWGFIIAGAVLFIYTLVYLIFGRRNNNE